MAKNSKRDKSEILTRTEKWELELSFETRALISKISDSLREYYVWALNEEASANEAYQAALKRSPDTKPNEKRFLNEIDLYNRFKDVRKEDASRGLFRARVPANWVLETFKLAVGAYKSFFALRKHGDIDARTPKEPPATLFQVIPGCSAFSLKAGKVALAPDIFGKGTLSFVIPPVYQAKMLARSVRVAKFIVSASDYGSKEERFWISVSYEIQKPEEVPFIPAQAVYVALGATHIGIVSQKGEEVIDLWRPDIHWKPRADAIEERMKKCVKGSLKWKRLNKARRTCLAMMAKQQRLDRREVVAQDLLRHGVHFVVTELVVRSKEGKLADSSKAERGGSLGLNWQAQNTSTLGYLAQWLEAKVPEFGGSVRRHKLPFELVPPGEGSENKIAMAKALRDDFLRLSQEEA